MRRHLLDLIVLFFFSRSIAGYVALAQPTLRNVTLHVYVFLVGGLLMLGIVAAAGDAVPAPAPLRARPRRSASPARRAEAAARAREARSAR